MKALNMNEERMSRLTILLVKKGARDPQIVVAIMGKGLICVPPEGVRSLGKLNDETLVESGIVFHCGRKGLREC